MLTRIHFRGYVGYIYFLGFDYRQRSWGRRFCTFFVSRNLTYFREWCKDTWQKWYMIRYNPFFKKRGSYSTLKETRSFHVWRKRESNIRQYAIKQNTASGLLLMTIIEIGISISKQCGGKPRQPVPPSLSDAIPTLPIAIVKQTPVVLNLIHLKPSHSAVGSSQPLTSIR